ncbi:MAG: dihydropteroate synthase [Candidatus Sumerlaeia bacterium]|nr:dihydropteroate synthase [Candidatus Sumerlaeia bacterium]
MASMTRIAAVINASPESFFKGSVAEDSERLTLAVQNADAAGADMIDIGAMSTAPNRETWVTEEEECERMRQAVRAARTITKLPISADTQRASVARVALEEGADYINDISAFRADPEMTSAVAGAKGAILMVREDKYLEERCRTPSECVLLLLQQALQRAETAGMSRENIILDPGIGFFRNRNSPWYEWDLDILRNLGLFRELGCPIMIGASRKSFMGHLLEETAPENRLPGSLAVAAWCANEGVEWVRVHDVRETRDVIRMFGYLRGTIPTP